MNLKKAISKEAISIDLKGTNKDEILEELVNVLGKSGKVSDMKGALKCVIEREKKMSTGMGNEIAIPHGKMKNQDALVAAIGIKKEGVDFEALDGQPVKLFIITISPSARTGPHIQFLAEISRLLSNDEHRMGMINAQSAEDVLNVINQSV